MIRTTLTILVLILFSTTSFAQECYTDSSGRQVCSLLQLPVTAGKSVLRLATNTVQTLAPPLQRSVVASNQPLVSVCENCVATSTVTTAQPAYFIRSEEVFYPLVRQSTLRHRIVARVRQTRLANFVQNLRPRARNCL